MFLKLPPLLLVRLLLQLFQNRLNVRMLARFAYWSVRSHVFLLLKLAVPFREISGVHLSKRVVTQLCSQLGVVDQPNFQRRVFSLFCGILIHNLFLLIYILFEIFLWVGVVLDQKLHEGRLRVLVYIIIMLRFKYAY